MSGLSRAYYVQRVSRCVVTLLVYAENADDARRRSREEGESLDVDYQSRGYASVRRAPDYDGMDRVGRTRDTRAPGVP